jgi:hypothetical protein
VDGWADGSWRMAQAEEQAEGHKTAWRTATMSAGRTVVGHSSRRTGWRTARLTAWRTVGAANICRVRIRRMSGRWTTLGI